MVTNGGSGRSRVYWHLPLQALAPHKGWRSSEVLLCSQVCPAVQLVGCGCAACGLPWGSAPSVLGAAVRQHLDIAGEGRALFPLGLAERGIYWLMTEGSRLTDKNHKPSALWMLLDQPLTSCSFTSKAPELPEGRKLLWWLPHAAVCLMRFHCTFEWLWSQAETVSPWVVLLLHSAHHSSHFSALLWCATACGQGRRAKCGFCGPQLCQACSAWVSSMHRAGWGPAARSPFHQKMSSSAWYSLLLFK